MGPYRYQNSLTFFTFHKIYSLSICVSASTYVQILLRSYIFSVILWQMPADLWTHLSPNIFAFRLICSYLHLILMSFYLSYEFFFSLSCFILFSCFLCMQCHLAVATTTISPPPPPPPSSPHRHRQYHRHAISWIRMLYGPIFIWFLALIQ